MRQKTDWPILLCGLLILAAILFRLAVAFHLAGDVQLTVWGDRDLWRALDPLAQLAGPEVNGGARPPGGAFYLLLGSLLAGHPGPFAAQYGVLVLFALSVAALGWLVGREVSPEAGLLSAAALAGSELLFEILTPWNPGYLPFFACIGTLAGWHYLRHRRWPSLFLAGVAIGVGLQIHLQMFQLGLALLVSLILWRDGRGVRGLLSHLPVLVGGVLLPFLPGLATAQGLAGLPPLDAMPAEAARNYMFGEFDPAGKALLVYELLGGDSGPLALASGTAPGILLGLVFAADLAVVLLAVGGARGLRLRGDGAAGFLLLVLSAGVLVIFGSAVNIRHLVVGVPAASLLAGLGGARVWQLARGRRALLPAGIILLALAELRPAILGGLALEGHGFSTGSIDAQSEIARTLKSSFYSRRDSFETKAALFHKTRRGWKLAEEGVSGQMAFIFRTTPAPVLPAERSECIAILPRAEVSGDPARDLAQAFGELSPKFSDERLTSAHFLYVPYAAAQGNCLKSFSNGYLPSEIEGHLGAGPVRQPEGWLIPLAIPGHQPPIGVELRREPDGIVAVLHGRLLRGYTGLYFQTIENARLCLVDQTGGVHLMSFGGGSVGSPQRGMLAPWRSETASPADGAYRVWLVGRDRMRPTPFALPAGRLSLPDFKMTVEGAPEAVPGACLGDIAGE